MNTKNLAASFALAVNFIIYPTCLADQTHANNNTVDIAGNLEEMADSIVLFRASEDMHLHIPVDNERILRGEIINYEKQDLRGSAIIHTRRTMISPVIKGGIYKLYLRKFPDREAYYLFARIDMNQK